MFHYPESKSLYFSAAFKLKEENPPSYNKAIALLKRYLKRYCVLTHLQGEADTQVHILGPNIIGRLVVEDREDATVQMALTCCLLVPGHGHDRGTRPISRQQMSRPKEKERNGESLNT